MDCACERVYIFFFFLTFFTFVELGVQGDLPVFRSVGKVFILAAKADLEKEAKESLAESNANEEKFENQAKFLMAKVKENEQQMGELMRQSGR